MIGDVMFGPLFRAVSTALFGPPRPRRDPVRRPDDRGFSGPSRPFSGWPNLTRKDPWSW